MNKEKREFLNRPTTANAVVIQEGKILLVRRKREPFEDYWAIPGGFVNISETTRQACLRELKEETGMIGEVKGLIGVFDDPNRDPRHTVSISFLVEPKKLAGAKAGSDAEDIGWFPLDDLPPLAFDHQEQIEDAIKLLSK